MNLGAAIADIMGRAAVALTVGRSSARPPPRQAGLQVHWTLHGQEHEEHGRQRAGEEASRGPARALADATAASSLPRREGEGGDAVKSSRRPIQSASANGHSSRAVDVEAGSGGGDEEDGADDEGDEEGAGGVESGERCTPLAPDEQQRGFRLLHESLRLWVDFERQILQGEADLQLWLCEPQPSEAVRPADAFTLRLNCRRCTIHRVTVNGIDAPFRLESALDDAAALATCAERIYPIPTVDAVEGHRARWAREAALGELHVEVSRALLGTVEGDAEAVGDGEDATKPETTWENQGAASRRTSAWRRQIPGEGGKMFAVCDVIMRIEYETWPDGGGAHFVVGDDVEEDPATSTPDHPDIPEASVDGTAQLPLLQHMYIESRYGMARLWMPCVDTPEARTGGRSRSIRHPLCVPSDGTGCCRRDPLRRRPLAGTARPPAPAEHDLLLRAWTVAPTREHHRLCAVGAGVARILFRGGAPDGLVQGGVCGRRHGGSATDKRRRRHRHRRRDRTLLRPGDRRRVPLTPPAGDGAGRDVARSRVPPGAPVGRVAVRRPGGVCRRAVSAQDSGQHLVSSVLSGCSEGGHRERTGPPAVLGAGAASSRQHAGLALPGDAAGGRAGPACRTQGRRGRQKCTSAEKVRGGASGRRRGGARGRAFVDAVAAQERRAEREDAGAPAGTPSQRAPEWFCAPVPGQQRISHLHLRISVRLARAQDRAGPETGGRPAPPGRRGARADALQGRHQGERARARGPLHRGVRSGRRGARV
eukprot:ctg_302.g125